MKAQVSSADLPATHKHMWRSEVFLNLLPSKTPIRREVCDCGETRMSEAISHLVRILQYPFGDWTA
jgi:hypothetical protein